LTVPDQRLALFADDSNLLIVGSNCALLEAQGNEIQWMFKKIWKCGFVSMN